MPNKPSSSSALSSIRGAVGALVLVGLAFQIRQNVSINKKLDFLVDLEEAALQQSPSNVTNDLPVPSLPTPVHKDVSLVNFLKQPLHEQRKNSSTTDEINIELTEKEEVESSSSSSWLAQYLTYNTSNIPLWMQDYFKWHNEHKPLINETNWTDHRYLILRCTHKDDDCGGTSDRLKPIPVFLRIGYQTNRIFLIHWNRPCSLEEFLEPNLLNWTVPEWMVPLIDDNGKRGSHASHGKQILYKSKTNKVLVEGKIQYNDGGQSNLKEFAGANRTHDYRYQIFYRDMFRMLFRPSPAVTQLVEQQMRERHLVSALSSLLGFQKGKCPSQ